jgi:flagellar motor switch/type III secretory pathway protein FliN
VRLTFTAGRVTLPFGTLSDVGPGYVFALDKRLDDQAILVHANDVPIAVGELVTIGDLIGVRIARMLPPA